MKKYFALVLAATIGLSACGFEASFSNGDELKGEGITFLVPSETSSSSSGDGGIMFDGESVSAGTDGKTLQVNDIAYGSLASGDIVDLRKPDKVLVNGVLRLPSKDKEEPQDRDKGAAEQGAAPNP